MGAFLNRLGVFFFLFLLPVSGAPYTYAATTIDMVTGADAYRIDWESKEGSFLYNWGRLPDERIPSRNHYIKNTIKEYIDPKFCGNGNLDSSKIAVFVADFSGRSIPGYILDASEYFSEGQGAACSTRMCDTTQSNVDKYGITRIPCLISLFLYKSPTQLPSNVPPPANEKDDLCPKNPAENTKCAPECPALPDMCPKLFAYNLGNPVFLTPFAYKWEFMSVESYLERTKNARDSKGRRIYRDSANVIPNIPVLAIDTVKDQCSLEELVQWVDDAYTDSQKFRCIKFYQYHWSGFINMAAPVL